MSAICRECGCTEDDACLVRVAVPEAVMRGDVVAQSGCWWIEPDRCCGCANPDMRVRGPLVDHRGESGDVCDNCGSPAEVNMGLYMDEPVLLCGACYAQAGDYDRPDDDDEYDEYEDDRLPGGEVDFEAPGTHRSGWWAGWVEGQAAAGER